MSTSPVPPPETSLPGSGDVPRERELQRAGREILFALYAAFRVLKIYPLENQTVQNALAELDALVRQLLALEGSVSLRYVGDFVFINDLRMRIDLGSFATFGAVGRMLRGHGIGQLDVAAGVDRTEWTAFLSLLLAAPDAEDPFARFEERLARTAVRHITPLAEVEAGHPAHDPGGAREAAKRTYAQTVAVAREAMTAVRIGRSISMRQVKRAVQSIVDQVLTNETSITGMTTLRDYDEYTFTHSVNVCIFSVALGKKLGLGKHELYELGLGALLHDVGKVRMPVEVINKSGALSPEERALLQEHPTEGFLALFEMRGFAELPLRPMLSVYEHHMKVDLTGYPQSQRPRNPTIFPRIVAIADGFDAATTLRSYQLQPWLPDQVLREMRDNPARGMDPLLVKAFISMTGIYPVGSVVVLDTYELAVVTEVHSHPEAIHDPVVKIIYDALGRLVDPPLEVDLADPAPGEPVRTIIKTADPVQYGINVGDYFV
ncbi:MAG TPA: HD domain-containing phosphohydrolase [Longimicrobiaceae bacterium]|nr:HD domain-containing phosphohydrolase [Longimicrobiaceae bacterium]